MGAFPSLGGTGGRKGEEDGGGPGVWAIDVGSISKSSQIKIPHTGDTDSLNVCG